MPVTVKQLIEHLSTLPQDAIVRVTKEETIHWNTFVDFEELELPYDVYTWQNNGQNFVDIG